MNDNERYNEKRTRLMERCFECLCENGLESTTTRMLSEACGVSMGTLFGYYFAGKDAAIIESMAYCMAKVGDEIIAGMPDSMDEMTEFFRQAPYGMCRRWGVELRLMYQVYLSPQYREHGKAFMDCMVERYKEYANDLALRMGKPIDVILPLVYWFVRICVHYSLFESEAYMKPQIELFLKMIDELRERYPSG